MSVRKCTIETLATRDRNKPNDGLRSSKNNGRSPLPSAVGCGDHVSFHEMPRPGAFDYSDGRVKT
jgi:hypothetical protein